MVSSLTPQQIADIIKFGSDISIFNDSEGQVLEDLFRRRLPLGHNDGDLGDALRGKEEPIANILFSLIIGINNSLEQELLIDLAVALGEKFPSFAEVLGKVGAITTQKGDIPSAPLIPRLLALLAERGVGSCGRLATLIAFVLRFAPDPIPSERIADARAFASLLEREISSAFDKYDCSSASVQHENGAGSVAATDLSSPLLWKSASDAPPNVRIISSLGCTIHALSCLLKRREHRTTVLSSGIIGHLLRVLIVFCRGESALVAQLTYETLLTLWVLSFDYSCLAEMAIKHAIEVTHRVLQEAQKEKILRMCLLIMRNFCAAQRRYTLSAQTNEWVEPSIYELGKIRRACGAVAGVGPLAPSNGAGTAGITADEYGYERQAGGEGRGPNFYSEMVSAGIMKTLWQLARRNFGDEDIPVYVNELTAIVEQNMDVVTSWSEYRAEVLSGVLSWTPVHTSAKFWKDNIARFEEGGYEQLRILYDLIKTTTDQLTLAVAVHDVGEVVRYHPSRAMLLSISSLEGLKSAIMLLMSSDSKEVAKEALIATQKILVQRWDYIQ